MSKQNHTEADAAKEPETTLDADAQKMVADIDGAVDQTIAKAKAERKAPADDDDGKTKEPSKQDLPPEEARSGEKPGAEAEPPEPDKGKEPEDPPPPDEGDGEITDAHVERAVKAGMTIADTKLFPKAEALERVCKMMEDAANLDKPAAEDKPGDEDEPGDEPDDEIEAALAGIPDLDPEEYDEEIVKGFKAMKDIIRGQAKTIKGQSAAGDARNWFDRQVDGLGSAVKDAMEAAPEKRTALQGKFKVLEAGYKAANEKVEPSAVFKEAVSLVLGDVVAQSDEQAKAAALASRSRQHIQRPGGPTAKAKADPADEVAEEINRKIASMN